MQQVIARLRIAEKALGAGRGPAYCPSRASGCLEKQGELGVGRPPCPEAAAHVRHDDPQPLGLDAEHGGKNPPHAVRGLAPEGQGPGVVPGVVARNRGPGLQEHRGDAVVRDGDFHYVRGRRERGVGRLAVALFPVEG